MIQVKSKVQLVQEFIKEYPDLDINKLPTYMDGAHVLTYKDGSVVDRARYEGYALMQVPSTSTVECKLLKFVRSNLFNHSTVIEVGDIL